MPSSTKEGLETAKQCLLELQNTAASRQAYYTLDSDTPSMSTLRELHEFAKANGLEATKKLLRQYVLQGQPQSFLPAYGTRSMCAVASLGLEGKPLDDVPYYKHRVRHSIVYVDVVRGGSVDKFE